MKRILITVWLLGALVLSAAERYVPEYLNKISVTVRAEAGYSRSEGSGTLYVRKVDGKDVTFCWTAGHVVADLKKVEEILRDGKTLRKVTFENPKLLRELRNKDGRRAGEVVVDAKVIRYSHAEEHDLALLMVISEDFKAEATVEFYPKDAGLPRIGIHLWHCGSLLGASGGGHNSVTDGVLSARGRILFKQPFDQQTPPAYAGSSGGIIADSKGRYLSMLVRGAGSDFNLSVPVARMWKWAADNDVEWAMNPGIPITMKEIDKLPIEGPAAKDGVSKGESKAYPFLIRRTSLPKE